VLVPLASLCKMSAVVGLYVKLPLAFTVSKAPLLLVKSAVLAVTVEFASMSVSLVSRLPVVAMVSSLVVPKLSVPAIGASLSPVTVIVATWVSVAPWSSVTV